MVKRKSRSERRLLRGQGQRFKREEPESIPPDVAVIRKMIECMRNYTRRRLGDDKDRVNEDSNSRPTRVTRMVGHRYLINSRYDGTILWPLTNKNARRECYHILKLVHQWQ